MSGAGGGFGGQHSDMLEVWFAHVPGLKVVVPSTPADQKALLLECIFDDNPRIFVESTRLMRASGPAPVAGYTARLGEARVEREGTDVTVIGYGHPMLDVRKVAEALGPQGISVEVIDLRTIAPFDEATLLASVAKTRRAVLVHEATLSFGVGAELAARLHARLWGQLRAPVERVAAHDTPVPFSKPLETAFMWSAAQIEAAIRRTLAA
jgi:pyruvate dehydrogenase E1 component beta subunit